MSKERRNELNSLLILRMPDGSLQKYINQGAVLIFLQKLRIECVNKTREEVFDLINTMETNIKNMRGLEE